MNLGYFEVGLNIQNIERSLGFYKTLGFELVNGGIDMRTVTITKGDCRIALYQGFGDDMLYLQFYQGDVEEIARDLTSKGLRFESRDAPFEETAPGSGVYGKHGRFDEGIAAILLDPDGHLLHFIKQRDRPEAPRDSALETFRALHTPEPSRMDFGWFEVSLPVRDIHESHAFYRQLGFHVVDDSVAGNVTLQSGDCRLGLYQGHLDPARPQLIFWQGDVEAIARDLTSRDLNFHTQPASDHRGAGAMLIDPDGHPLYFVNLHGLVRKDGG